MPNLDFYAVGDDLTAVLDLVFTDGACHVFESYSEFDSELVEFASTREIAARYRLGELQGTAHEPLLMLVPKPELRNISIRRIALRPEKCKGATFRYCIEGLGLIGLHLGGIGRGKLINSHTNHNSEKRARAWESMCIDRTGLVDAWNWKEVERISRRLNRQITKLAVDKSHSRPILPQAADLLKTQVISI